MQTKYSKTSGTAGLGQGNTACPNCGQTIGIRSFTCKHCDTLTSKGAAQPAWKRKQLIAACQLAADAKADRAERLKPLEVKQSEVESLRALLVQTRNSQTIANKTASEHAEAVKLLEKQLVKLEHAAQAAEMAQHEKSLDYDETEVESGNLTYPKSMFAMLSAFARLTESGAIEFKGNRMIVNFDELA